MDLATVQGLLNRFGFPCGPVDGVLGPKTKAATARFQQAYNGPDGWLEMDGIPGPKTQAALEDLPRLSINFAVHELACHHCGHAYVRRELLAALEEWRRELGRPIPLLSAYRCKQHNAAVGGASKSMHVEGFAADPNVPADVDDVQALELFSGIGEGRFDVIRHVDLRHLSPNNQTPSATPASPARWTY